MRLATRTACSRLRRHATGTRAVVDEQRENHKPEERGAKDSEELGGLDKAEYALLGEPEDEDDDERAARHPRPPGAEPG